MSIQSTLQLRRDELPRRVEALPAEVDEWKNRTRQQVDENAHFSQIEAIGTLMAEFIQRQRALLARLDPAGSADGFTAACFQLILEIIRAQRVWDFFRQKLNLRLIPALKDPLWVADTIAWDCYRPVLNRAADEGIVPRSELREPPLTYLTAEFSPATWVRGSRPNDGRDYALGMALLPIPVIEMPWDHVENVWEFLSLDHEVGHDLEADLKLRGPLQSALQTQLSQAGVAADRVRVWCSWEGEVFADLIGLQQGGPAFAEALLHLLLLPAADVTTYNPSDPHPTHYIRILMNAAYVRTLVPGRNELTAHAEQIEQLWRGLYGEQPYLAAFTGDFPHVFQALMDTPFPVLKGKTVRQLIPFTAAHDAAIRAAADYLRTGQNAPAQLAPRHCVSAARVAVTRVSQAGGDLATSLKEIHARTTDLVRQNAPPGLRAAEDSAPHRRFIANFAQTVPF